MTSLSTRIVAGVKLTFLASLISAITQAVILVVLARLLTPTDYGRFAVATVFARLTAGLAIGILERALLTGDVELSRIESPYIPLSLVFVISIVSLSFVYSFELVDEEMFPALAIVQLAVLFPASVLIQRVSLRRELRVFPIVAADYAGQFFGLGAMTILLAHQEFGVMALALGSLTQAIIQATIISYARRPKFNIRWTLDSFHKALYGALRVLPTAGLELLFVQLPSILIGWQFGLNALGVFTRIYSLFQLPIEILTTSITRVLVAGLVHTREDDVRSKLALERLITIASMLITPLVGGIIGSHVQVISVVLGPRWSEGASISIPLVLSTWMAVQAHLFAVFSEARALYIRKAAVQAAAIGVQILAMVAGGYLFGIVGAAVGLALANMSFLVANVVLVRQWLPFKGRELARWVHPGLFAGLVAGICGYAVPRILPHSDLVTIFFAQVFMCALSSGAVLFLIGGENVRSLLKTLGIGRRAG